MLLVRRVIAHSRSASVDACVTTAEEADNFGFHRQKYQRASFRQNLASNVDDLFNPHGAHELHIELEDLWNFERPIKRMRTKPASS
ncbi:hypothetical protein [Rhizobium leguminosarum]|uniref:hypothetical protein n=1 Tax=Rhizobium leguminosarum TaxID=384 RepID=UPI001C90F370|nr:hypothetical protein [Rhizobium leguminosarum]MBY3043781.1 hypothetical protein [Rhizobium leguminosarum]